MATKTIYHLEMRYPHELRTTPKIESMRENAKLELVSPDDFIYNRKMYETVGADYGWVGRRGMDLDYWQRYCSNPCLKTFAFKYNNEHVGYTELIYFHDNPTYIAYFGLLKEFHGRGLGGLFLVMTIEQAWENYTRLVTVNTCTLDSPAALPNYLARGFRMYKAEKVDD